jgi:predicted transcriptional regulator
MTTLTIELPDSLTKNIEELASREGYTVSQFLASAASEKLAVVLTMDYLRREAASGRQQDFEHYLKLAHRVWIELKLKRVGLRGFSYAEARAIGCRADLKTLSKVVSEGRCGSKSAFAGDPLDPKSGRLQKILCAGHS